jgi:hypothetical protein
LEVFVALLVAALSILVVPAIGRAGDLAEPGVFSPKTNRMIALCFNIGFHGFIAILSFYSSKPLTPQQFATVSVTFSLLFIVFGLFAVLSVYRKEGSVSGVLNWRDPNFDYLYKDIRNIQKKIVKISFTDLDKAAQGESTALQSATERSTMTRRVSFIKFTGTEDLAPATAPKLVRDSNSPLRAKGMKSFYNNWKQCYFALGSPFGQSVETEVQLVPDPDNRFDKNAVAVICEGVVLGYIPTELALSLKTLINSVGGVVLADAELWFDFRTRTEKRNSVRLLVAQPFRIQGS